MVNPSEHGVQRVVHHKDYYIRGGDMTVLVENHLYRVHSYFFERESLFFRQKLTGSANDGEERVGSSDLNAYTLDDVKSEDFARFLWVFYNPKYSLYDAPLEVWLSILHLANRWSFVSVKDLTIRELEKIYIEPVDKIAIYHEYAINRAFLIPSYIAVCKRDKPLSFAEGSKLGMETVLRIADARERARQRAAESGVRTPTFDDFEDSEMETMVREVFGVGSRPVSPLMNGSNGNLGNGNGNANGGYGFNGTTSPRARSASPEPPRSSVQHQRMPSIGSTLQSITTPPAPAAAPAVPVPKTLPPAPEPSPSVPVTPAIATGANKNGGTGEPSSEEAKELEGGVFSPVPDLTVPTPVDVQTPSNDDQIKDDSDANDTGNNTEKDDPLKDDASKDVFSDTEGKPGNPTGRGGKTNRRGGGGRGKRGQ